ncbi:MAG TPA: hypothetical protein VFN21_00895 [Acidimicrobiales bacterium]|nr:hypothetical protein [Acidimicrobiales bacterium]
MSVMRTLHATAANAWSDARSKAYGISGVLRPSGSVFATVTAIAPTGAGAPSRRPT